MKNACVVVLTTILGLLLFPARAFGDEGRVVVVVVEGPANAEIAKSVGAHVTAPHKVDEPAAFRAALTRRGTRTLAPALKGGARNTELVAHARAAAADAKVDAAVLVTVSKGNKRVHVWVVNAREEASDADKDVSVPAGGGAGAVADAVWTVAAGALPAPKPEPVAKNEPPPKVDLTPAPEPRDTNTSRPTPPRVGPPRSKALVIVEPGMGFGLRSYSIVDRRTASLRPYSLPAAPLPSIAVEVYPLARSGMPIVEGIGITADYARAIAVDSTDSTGKRVDTSWQSWDIGLRGQWMLGPALVGAGFGYGAIDFELGDLGPGAQLPTVSYRLLQPGLDGRLFFGKLSVFAGASYLAALSTGEIDRTFPRASVGGIGARLGGGFSITDNLEVSLGAGYTRFFYSFHPEPGDANVAGGALDQMFRASAGLAIML